MSEGLQLQKDLGIEHEKLSKLKDAELKLLQQPESKRSEELIERLAWTKTHHFERIAEIKFQIEARVLLMDKLYRKHSIQVFKSCYAGVFCQIGENNLKVKTEHGPCNFITNGRMINLEPL